MNHARNFSPEWGYFAPAPNFLRTARVFVVAVAIGAASAAVVFSLMDRPIGETSVAARTMVRSAEPTLQASARSVPTAEAQLGGVLAGESDIAAAAEAAAAAAAAPPPTPAPRKRAVARHYDVPRYTRRYDSIERGPYAFLRRYGSYGQAY
jgi:hypothetical protein